MVMLEGMGFQPIGVQFIHSRDELQGLAPTNWHPWKTPVGFDGRQIGHDWANVRSKFLKEGAPVGASIAGKIRTYLRLLSLRLRHLSDAYHVTLRYRLVGMASDGAPEPGMFSNLWKDEIDAAIHAFCSDAASFRDALAEACWKLILRKTDNQVTTMAGLIKHTKGEPNPFIVQVIQRTKEGDWIKNLGDLRDAIVHVVPVGGLHEHSYLELRARPVGSAMLHCLHYPLTTEDWALRRDVARSVDYSSEGAVHQSILEYTEFAKTSGDALEYAWRTLSLLSALAGDIRREAGLHADPPLITSADIIPGSFKTARSRV